MFELSDMKCIACGTAAW